MMEQIQRRRRAVSTVYDIVSAMRAIAAGRIQDAQRALRSARRYHDIVTQAMAALLAETVLPTQLDGRRTRVGLLVMTSEHSLCGAFNHNILALAERRCEEIRQEGDLLLLVVGQKGLRQLVARGINPDGAESAATSLSGLHDLVKRLAILLGERYARGELGSLRVVYSRLKSVSEQVPTDELVLPLDLRTIRQSADAYRGIYHHYDGAPEVLAGLVSEYAFISLYRIAAESYASEQASRLVAMDAAARNTERVLEELIGLERRERQGLITRQVLELIRARFTAES